MRLEGGMCDRGAVRPGMGYGICEWRSCFLLHLPRVSRITQRAWEEQDDKTGLSCSLLLLPSGGVERHHRQILMGDLHPKGRWRGGCGNCKWRS